jgi:hypothetical protein
LPAIHLDGTMSSISINPYDAPQISLTLRVLNPRSDTIVSRYFGRIVGSVSLQVRYDMMFTLTSLLLPIGLARSKLWCDEFHPTTKEVVGSNRLLEATRRMQPRPLDYLRARKEQWKINYCGAAGRELKL